MTHVAFLRAVNVGGRGVVKMTDLQKAFTAAGAKDVRTVIASGNVVFDLAAGKKTAPLERTIEAMLKGALGYDVATFVRTATEVKAVAEHQPFSPAALKKAFTFNVAFLRQAPDAKAVKALDAAKTASDTFHVRGRELYWLSTIGQGQSKMSNAVFEKKLGMQSTVRGIGTVRKIAERW